MPRELMATLLNGGGWAALTSLADRVHVMHHGATLFEGSPEEMLANDRVIEVYLGSRHRKAS